jgi:FKBP12-rapamycin complex-associated protein
MWTKRLRGVQSNVEVWQNLLSVHTLVIPPEGNVEGWLKFASLCRKTGKHHMCYKAITKLLRGMPDDGGIIPLDPSVDPKITLAWVKVAFLKRHFSCQPALRRMSTRLTFENCRQYLWATDKRQQAMEALHVMTRDQRGTSAMQARCHLKSGLWLQEKDEQLNPQLFGAILHAYRNATQLDSKWYKAWHHWALFNFDVVSFHERGGVVGGAGSRHGGGAGGVSYLVPAGVLGVGVGVGDCSVCCSRVL